MTAYRVRVDGPDGLVIDERVEVNDAWAEQEQRVLDGRGDQRVDLARLALLVAAPDLCPFDCDGCRS